MLKSILVGVDGTVSGQSAATLARRWASRFEAVVVGIGIIDRPDILAPEPVPLGGAAFKEMADEARLQRARDQVERWLEEFGDGCAAAGVAAKLIKDEGHPYEQIVLEAQRHDLIMLGRHPHFNFATQPADHHTLHRVLKTCSRPVVAAPEELPAGESVLIAFDGSLQAARALQAFEGTGLAQGHSVHVVSINRSREEAVRLVERAAEFLGYHGVQAVQCPVVTGSSVSDVILDQAKRIQAGLIVMGAYGQPVVREFFLGSVTRTLLESANTCLFFAH